MRAIWSGSLNFGLVTIPIKLFSATEDHDLPLHQVHEADGGRIRYQRRCEICGKVVEYRDIAKAYEAPDGRSVMLTDDDLARLPADRSKEISVEQFAPAEQIDALLFERSYYLEPSAQAAKAYVLLRTILERTDRVAVVRFALRQRTQLGVLRVHDGALAVQSLRWPDEVRSFELPQKVVDASVTRRELDMAGTLVESYVGDFEPDQFTDEHRNQLEQLVEAKLAGGEAFSAPGEVDEGPDAEIVDLLAVLERSVARKAGTSATTGGKASGAKARGGTRGKARGGGSDRAARGGARAEASADSRGKASGDTHGGTRGRKSA
jgi:DNA end-binding protein Ku